jgi:hypothetical protein
VYGTTIKVLLRIAEHFLGLSLNRQLKMNLVDENAMTCYYLLNLLTIKSVSVKISIRH